MEVTKAMLTVSAEAKEKIYGEANPALTFLYSGWVLSEDESLLDTKPVAATTVTAATDAGLYTADITVAGGADTNYDFTYTTADFTVNKATLTVTADNKEKVYGSANPALTFQYSGFIAGEDETVLDTEPLAATTIVNNSAAGLYSATITVDGGVDNNYQFSYVPANFNITKAMLTATADSKTKVYGASLPTLTFQYTGWVLSEDESILDTKPVAATTVTENSITGTYSDAITVAGGADDNYNFTYVAADMEVTKAMLTVSAEAKEKIYGEANPALTFLYSGWVLSEDESVLDTKPVAATTVTAATDAGLYTADIAVAGGADTNYDFTYTPADFTVNKATLTVTADNKEKVYGTSNPVLTFSYSGFVLDNGPSVILTAPIISTDAGQVSNTGDYNIYFTGGFDENYTFSYVPGTLKIVKADQTITFQPVSQGLRITEEETLVATSTSGLTIEFELLTPETGLLSGNYITIIREGTLTVVASQPGDHNWNSALSVTQSVTTLPTFDNVTSLFTPNNDGMNDYWYLPGLFEMGRVHVKVYNRFGKMVYESSSYENNWDGTWNGKPLPAGSYYYLINSSVRGMIKGTVNIVR
jgi:gliding motility-associated-like protein